ncbi:probable ubiquitin-conjugating enzyme E2 24 [Mercurialis annua]|uniref:probable ubiquitin-conjugating enzyme E2 24 n=1 Tax=Mercurialis annua TaxID=3986 RepID=UPI00216039A0|nr:probable ubiquitin-conjugating enzyme E2 24 [Mercurialis annua]
MATDIEKEEFKQFDIVTDYSDHSYKNNVVRFTNPQRITKEWRNLEKNLPDSIYVRVYEGRMDLLRAVIIGADGTPYHDGLFFFDIKFPAHYPNQPPLVCYRAHGIKLNPNLFSNGYVCLSLLNTYGSNEKGALWDPSRSTIFQVLLSIQALVLNSKPYFNEPHMFSSSEETLHYNKQVFTLSCKTMLSLWRRPPKNFECFVKDHFKLRANKILKACKDYDDGNAIAGSEEIVNGNCAKASKEWKIMMKDVHSLLDAAFNKNQDVGPNKLPSLKPTKTAYLETLIIIAMVIFPIMLFGIVLGMIFIHT